jgi:hypothetical protein
MFKELKCYQIFNLHSRGNPIFDADEHRSLGLGNEEKTIIVCVYLRKSASQFTRLSHNQNLTAPRSLNTHNTEALRSTSDHQWIELGAIIIYIQALVSLEEIHYFVGQRCYSSLINRFSKPLGQDG